MKKIVIKKDIYDYFNTEIRPDDLAEFDANRILLSFKKEEDFDQAIDKLNNFKERKRG